MLPAILPQLFYERPTQEVARDLLGKVLVHNSEEGVASGTVVEAEAYLGANDPGSHASIRRTPRNSVMFGRAGVAYVYFTYGMHYCFNAVAKPTGMAGAVLVRALEPLEGISLMKERRRNEDLLALTSGPGKLTQALAIDASLNGADLTEGDLYIAEGAKAEEIRTTYRIGLSKGVQLPYRYYVADSRFVSRMR